MKEYSTDRIRNVAVASHQGTGKTSLIEAMLFTAGHTTRMGKVEEGNTVSDWDPDEVSHQMSINATVVPVEWKDHKLNLIDTPGYADFAGEVREALRVADGVLFVVSAVDGLQVGTDMTWEIADEQNMAKIVYVNKMDRENADFESVVEQLQERFHRREQGRERDHIVPVEVPIGAGETYQGIVDVLRRRAYSYSEGKVGEIPIPDDLRARMEEYRQDLVESICETDDELMEQYLEGPDIGDEQLIKALHAATARGEIVPIGCGSATLNMGTSEWLDALIDYIPSPTETHPEADGNLAALVFKSIADPFVGKLSYFRVYGGCLRTDSHVWNSTHEHDEHVGPILVTRGKQQEHVAQAPTGDIAAVAKLRDTHTGDTLSAKGRAVVLEGIEFPAPSFAALVIAKTKSDLDKLGGALQRIKDEDPTLHVERDTESGETILSGIGESHLKIAVERMKRKFNVDIDLGEPQVRYRETILGSAKAEGRHKKQTGGRGQFGDVWVEFEPNADQGYEFVNKIVGGAVPKQYIPAVDKGIQEALQRGPLAGYPVIDVKATLYDGKYHDVDSSEMAFKIAGSLAVREGLSRANPVLLEPMVDLEIIVPEEFTGDVTGDLSSRRGRVLGMEPVGAGRTRVTAIAPAAEVAHYATTLRSITQGRGAFTASAAGYEQVPPYEAQKIAEARGQKQAV